MVSPPHMSASETTIVPPAENGAMETVATVEVSKRRMFSVDTTALYFASEVKAGVCNSSVVSLGIKTNVPDESRCQRILVPI